MTKVWTGIASGLAVLATATSVGAATLILGGSTDTSLAVTPTGFALDVRDQGFLYRTDTRNNSGNMLSLQDSPGLTKSTIQAADMGRFDLNALTFRGQSRVYMTGPLDFDPTGSQSRSDWARFEIPTFDNFLVEGLRDGAVVASQMASTDVTAQTLALTDNFMDLDSVVISLLYPNPQNVQIGFGLPSTIKANTIWCDEYCTGLAIDSASVSTVPVPPAIWLLGSGLALLVVGGRRRRRHG